MARPRPKDPWLQKRGDVWYAYWYDAERGHKRKKSLETRDHVVAASKFAEFLVRGVDDPATRRGVPGIRATVTQVLDWYEKDHVDTCASPERQRYAIEPLKRHFRDRPVAEVDIESSRAYRLQRVRGLGGGRKVSESTVRRELGALVAAANHALRWKRIKPDELPQVELPTEPQDKKPWLTKASIRLIFEKADGDLRDFCMLAYYWASRRAAVEGLRALQVDLQHGRVDLHPPGARRTKKRRPIVPIYPEIRPLLERRMEPGADWLFGHKDREFYTAFKKLCRDHGIKAVDAPEGETPWPHLLRHSRASHLLMSGESIYMVAKLLGDTVATVEKVYGHHSAEYLAMAKGDLYADAG